jgi:hypothetical protein
MICADCAIIIADGLQYLFIYFIYDVYIVWYFTCMNDK